MNCITGGLAAGKAEQVNGMISKSSEVPLQNIGRRS